MENSSLYSFNHEIYQIYWSKSHKITSLKNFWIKWYYGQKSFYIFLSLSLLCNPHTLIKMKCHFIASSKDHSKSLSNAKLSSLGIDLSVLSNYQREFSPFYTKNFFKNMLWKRSFLDTCKRAEVVLRPSPFNYHL